MNKSCNPFLFGEVRYSSARSFDVPWDEALKEGGSCPDIVALNLSKREVVVVEVNSASGIRDYLNMIDTRQVRWFNPVMRQLQKSGNVSANWEIRFLGFVRKSNVNAAEVRFASHKDVAFYAIEVQLGLLEQPN